MAPGMSRTLRGIAKVSKATGQKQLCNAVCVEACLIDHLEYVPHHHQLTGGLSPLTFDVVYCPLIERTVLSGACCCADALFSRIAPLALANQLAVQQPPPWSEP